MDSQDLRFVVFTAISGNYDCLKEPKYMNEDVDYICFTDNEDLESGTWLMAPFPTSFEDKTLQARHVKTLAHRFLSEYDISIWIDANVVIRQDIVELAQNALSLADIAMFQHPQNHSSVSEEVQACISLDKEIPNKLLEQESLYYALGFTDSGNPIPASYVIFRRHNKPDIMLAMEDWWLHILSYSKRDQVSLPFIIWKNNINVTLLSHDLFLSHFIQYPHDGDLRDRILHLLAQGGLFMVSDVGGVLQVQQQGLSSRRMSEIVNLVLQSLQEQGVWTVIHGPFEGLIYPQLLATGSALIPKLLGTYESELHKTMLEIIAKRYDTIINIGAGEGYYAVGLLLKSQGSRLIAFEAEPQGQQACKLMAAANHVQDRLNVCGICTIGDLDDITQDYKTGLILCDCEGYEVELLDPSRISYLRYFDLLVELHDLSPHGLTIAEFFQSRFSSTHDIKFINVKPQHDISHLQFDGVSNSELQVLINEGRKYSIGWIFLTPKEINNEQSILACT